MSLDSYYLPTPPEHLSIHGAQNFDHPDAFDWALLKEHIRMLKSGLAVDVPVYDFKISRRKENRVAPLGPCRAIMVEGILALWDESVRDLFDTKIFLHVDADIRFIRRLNRDVRERGRSIDSIIKQYYDTVRPMHREYIDTQRQYADITVGEETDPAAELLSSHIIGTLLR